MRPTTKEIELMDEFVKFWQANRYAADTDDKRQAIQSYKLALELVKARREAILEEI